MKPDTSITRQTFNEAEKLSTFAHQRRFLFDKMECMERENAKLRETIKAIRAVNIDEYGQTGDEAVERLIVSCEAYNAKP